MSSSVFDATIKKLKASMPPPLFAYIDHAVSCGQCGPALMSIGFSFSFGGNPLPEVKTRQQALDHLGSIQCDAGIELIKAVRPEHIKVAGKNFAQLIAEVGTATDN